MTDKNKGYQPIHGNVDIINPPQGGSGFSDHTPPPLPKQEESVYLHLITYELQRIANAHEFFALVEIQEREGKVGHPNELTQLRIDDLTEKIKEARV